MNLQKNLLQSLIAISENSASSDKLLDKFSENFLNYASETPDNLDCLEQLKIVDGKFFGLGLKSGELISDILHIAEGSDIPPQVKKSYPNLSQNQWDAVLRLAMVILMIFEAER